MPDAAVQPPESFRITCVCGQAFNIDASKLLRHVGCPACHRALIAVPATPVGAGAHPNETEAVPIFRLRVSQWDNFWRYLTCLSVLGIALAVFFIPPIKPNALAIYLCVALLDALTMILLFVSAFTSRCAIYPSHLETQVGVFTRTISTLSLARVIEAQLQQNIFQRILGIGTIVVKTTDPNVPELELYQIRRPKKVLAYLRNHIGRFPGVTNS